MPLSEFGVITEQSGLGNWVTRLILLVQAMMPPALVQVLVSIAERLLSNLPGNSEDPVTTAPMEQLPNTITAKTEPIKEPTSEREKDPISEEKHSPDPKPVIDCFLSPSVNQSYIIPKLVLSALGSSQSVKPINSASDNQPSSDETNNGTKNASPNERASLLTSVATSPTYPKRTDPLFAEHQTTPNERPGSLDWCRWPVCMAYYLHGTCPFGEAACPDAHASAIYDRVINDKGLVRVCFDALGVGGRMCLRSPGYCRFFHAPAHIRYQLLEIRHKNRQRSGRSYLHPSSSTYPYTDSEVPHPTEWSPQAETRPSGNQQGSVSTEATISAAAVIAAIVARLVIESSHTQDTTNLLDRLVQALSHPGRQNAPQSQYSANHHCLIPAYYTGFRTGLHNSQHLVQRSNAV
ncbi:hypothetical protein D915_001719 [Fasciola hepatica]|uniref:C3H1-type domain-containing protein n=1 Tax=Fasciola hepatica TaxID=6192 RepID=A0A4E0RLC8_FASHE|nr:hypothetical protein D915_001719 [Fasciola hepatica]